MQKHRHGQGRVGGWARGGEERGRHQMPGDGVKGQDGSREHDWIKDGSHVNSDK